MSAIGSGRCDICGIGSDRFGTDESFCKALTARLEGSGMRWDKPNVEAVMVLAAVRQSNLWDTYWTIQRAAA